LFGFLTFQRKSYLLKKGNCSGVRGFRRRRQQAGRRIGLTGESLEKDGEGGLGILASGG